ncbi:unnamed protein product [Phytomonas sp. Hart1]|nr:unnamed protein product [Phytomonas sp. Hart1]|eukprot:CCW67700.1 unnamed protein product [Phytomonas sp. isolate Hart1]
MFWVTTHHMCDYICFKYLLSGVLLNCFDFFKFNEFKSTFFNHRLAQYSPLTVSMSTIRNRECFKRK